MARKLPHDSLPMNWADNPHVEFSGEWSLVKKGYWHAPLKLPLAYNRRSCLLLARIYAESRYEALFASEHFVQALDQPDVTLSGGVVFTGSSAHYHYLVDGLANLIPDLFQRHRTLFIDEGLSADQEAFLRNYVALMTPHAIAIERIPPVTCALDDVAVPTNSPTEKKIGRLRGWLEKLEDGNDSPGGCRVYVSRRRAGTRRLQNEHALAGALADTLGFEVVENEDLTLREQVRRFRDVTVVVGPHGAGLANLLFARKPRALIEFFHSVRQRFFEDVASFAGADYLAIEGVAAADADAVERRDNRDYTVDIARAVARIESLLTGEPRSS